MFDIAKQTKKQLFYAEIINIINSKMNLRYDNIKEIEADIKVYIETQTHLKKVTHSIWNKEHLITQIQINSIKLIINNIQELVNLAENIGIEVRI